MYDIKSILKTMATRNINYDGSELHRLKEMKEYDPKDFNYIYKIAKPVIRNMVRQIDARRYNLTPDIIRDQFLDKVIYVFNKYYGTCSMEHLKARVLSSLSTYKCKILRMAYTDQAEYNMNLRKLEDLFDNSKEEPGDEDIEEQKAKSQMLEILYTYMKKHLSRDAYILFEVLITPPPYIREKLKHPSDRINNLLLLDFFGLERKKSSQKYISELREEITFWEEQAKRELKY